MGWGTDFTTDIYLSRMTFDNEYQLDDKIKKVEKDINFATERILMYCSSNPSEVVIDDEGFEPIEYLHQRVKELLEEYEENVILLSKLEMYKETNPFNNEK